jgi:hypothetical protein
MIKLALNVTILFFITAHSSYASPDLPEPEDDEKKGPAYVIIDTTGGTPGVPAIKTNLRTGVEGDNGNPSASLCSKDDALKRGVCNSFQLENSDLYVMQRENDDALSLDVGVFNNSSTSYNNRGTPNELTYFKPGQHIFDLQRFREAAGELSKKKSNLPAFTYGTISWQQFIQNVAAGETMTGLVRVKIPLQQITTPQKTGEEGKFRSRSGKRYGFCGSKKISKCGCGPGKDDDNDGDFEATNIKPGETVCGIKIPSKAQISVRGAIMFDWVDCEKEGQPPIALDDLPESPRDLYFKVSVPININPANPRAVDGVMQNIDNLASIAAGKQCPNNSIEGCRIAFDKNTDFNFSWVSQDAKDRFLFKSGKELTSAIFSALPAAEQYNLLMPSGYEQGWATAFRELGITHRYWQENLGFRSGVIAPDSKTNDAKPAKYDQIISEADIRSSGFEDVPVYMYTGGLVDMHHHVNISGLVYVPQAMELEQKGLKLEKRQIKYEREGKHDDDDDKSKSKSYSSNDKDHDHEVKSCQRPQEHYEVYIPAKQYISGAVLVRDAFFVEAEHEGGVTIISQYPDSYDQSRLAKGIRVGNRYKPHGGEKNVTKVSNSNNNGKNDDDNDSAGGEEKNGGNTSAGPNSGGKDDADKPSANPAGEFNPGAQWIEIRPR